MSTTSESIAAVKPIPLWRRFAALLYDVFPLIGLWIVGAGLWVLVFHRIYDAQHPDPVLHVLLDLWLFVITAAYFVVSWTRVGATIGMRAWKLRLVGRDGARMGRVLACKRFVLALLSLATLGCGFWYAWFDGERRTWHDRVCGTHMTRL
ncbi:MAG: RDD family protein [Rhodanobacteraceae bacterium]|nr:MAG: RDD family protein [Rhodanobacteraceae bacterium]